MNTPVVVDTGPLVAIADRDDAHHQACLDHHHGPVIVPAPVSVEVCWLLGRRVGPVAEAAFLAALTGGDPRIEALDSVDYQRAGQLVDRYADLDLGFVDAAVVAIAERLRIDTVATINHRDFRVVRPSHVDSFTLVP
ncbi:MAG: PIN domain-containing protein [Acidimicrobiales bacterium]|nr:PIN domain-containing protein [Acidimicrobiales bacterium]